MSAGYGVLDGAGHLADVVNAGAADAVGIEQLDEIGVDQVGGHRMAAPVGLVALEDAPMRNR